MTTLIHNSSEYNSAFWKRNSYLSICVGVMPTGRFLDFQALECKRRIIIYYIYIYIVILVWIPCM